MIARLADSGLCPIRGRGGLGPLSDVPGVQCPVPHAGLECCGPRRPGQRSRVLACAAAPGTRRAVGPRVAARLTWSRSTALDKNLTLYKNIER